MRRHTHYGSRSWGSWNWGWGRWHRSFVITSSLIPLMILFGGRVRVSRSSTLLAVVGASLVAFLTCIVVATRKSASRRARRVALGAGMVLLALVLLLLRDRLPGTPWR